MPVSIIVFNSSESFASLCALSLVSSNLGSSTLTLTILRSLEKFRKSDIYTSCASIKLSELICSADFSKCEHISVSEISCDAILSKSPRIDYDGRGRFSRLPNNTMTIYSSAVITHSSGTDTMDKSSLSAKSKLTFITCSCAWRSSCNVSMHSFILEQVISVEIWLSPIIDHPTSMSSLNNKLVDKLYIHNNI